MKRITIYLTLLGLIALGLLATTRSGQSQQNQFPEYPPEFSPLRTSRPAEQQGSLIPKTRFVKVRNPIPNRYIVVLNDDVVQENASLEVRRARIRGIANRHALAQGGTVSYIYETALKGFAIELPNEAAAIAISNSPQVQWVEEDERFEPAQAPVSPQPSPPWGLDSVDGNMPALAPNVTGRNNGSYFFSANGAGVHAYVLDTGINTAHQDFQTPFFSRASQAADCIRHNDCVSGPRAFVDSMCPALPASNNDCWGHGTHVAATLGGNQFGVAKGVTIRSVKVCAVGAGCPASAIIEGVDWVTLDHLLGTPFTPKVVNMSIWGSNSAPFNDRTGIDAAVNHSINTGVTYVVIAGNANADARDFHPADVVAALTVGAVDWNANRWIEPFQGSNWGPRVDLFAPGVQIVSAQTGNNMPPPCSVWNGSNSSECLATGTSQAGPHVAGVVAMYLQGRQGVINCGAVPIQGPAPPSGNFSTCPDRVSQFIKATANLNRLTSSINGTIIVGGVPVTIPSPNRFVRNASIPTHPNPINNQRFFVWQHYADFLVNQPEPDENGLDFWTGTITNTCGTGFNFNTNNACTAGKRIDVSRAFWVAAFPSLFNAQGTTDNAQFVQRCYQQYLRRTVPPTDGGFQFWLNSLNQFGNPANFDGVNMLIDAFINSFEYKRRFGPQ